MHVSLAYNNQRVRTTSLTIAGSSDDYHEMNRRVSQIVCEQRKVLQQAVFMYMITGNAEDKSLKCYILWNKEVINSVN
jgi:hypothetical protein